MPRSKKEQAKSASHKAKKAARVNRKVAKKGNRVLGLDNSSKACGWSVFEDGVLIAHGLYLQKGKGHGQKLMNFRLWLFSIYKEWNPDIVIYEAPYPGRRRHTYGVLSRYVGVLEAAHYEYFGHEFEKCHAIAPGSIKRAIGAKRGKNHEDNKRIVVALVNKSFGLRLKYKANDTTKKVSQDDVADAIALNWAWEVMKDE